jgi:hypothetical protein
VFHGLSGKQMLPRDLYTKCRDSTQHSTGTDVETVRVSTKAGGNLKDVKITMTAGI